MPRKKRNAFVSESSLAMDKRIQRLAQVQTALEKKTRTYFPITRLTIVKGLCPNYALLQPERQG